MVMVMVIMGWANANVRWSMGSDLKKKYIIIALDSVLGS